jgi:hypothetical protein
MRRATKRATRRRDRCGSQVSGEIRTDHRPVDQLDSNSGRIPVVDEHGGILAIESAGLEAKPALLQLLGHGVGQFFVSRVERFGPVHGHDTDGAALVDEQDRLERVGSHRTLPGRRANW